MVTVGDLLADDALGLRSVHVPEPDAEVRWVAPSELADPAPFLEGGEVLLTTGLEAVGWRSEWQAYADRLVAARVVALGFATGLSHRDVPRGLVRACEAADLNLFEVPRKTTFVAISRATARMIDVGAEAEARRSLQVQRQLTQAALRPREPEALVGRLAEMLDGAAAVLGRDGQVELGPLGPRADDLDPVLVGAEVARIRPQGLRAASTVQSAGETLVVQPVGLAGRPSSYLAVLVPGRAGDLARSAVATAVSLLGLAAESDRTGRQRRPTAAGQGARAPGRGRRRHRGRRAVGRNRPRGLAAGPGGGGPRPRAGRGARRRARRCGGRGAARGADRRRAVAGGDARRGGTSRRTSSPSAGCWSGSATPPASATPVAATRTPGRRSGRRRPPYRSCGGSG